MMRKFLLCVVFFLVCFILCGCDNENKPLVKLPVTKEPTVEYSSMIGDILEGNMCGNAPSWVYSTSYWTGTAYDS